MVLLSDKPRAALLCCPLLLEPHECRRSQCRGGSGMGWCSRGLAGADAHRGSCSARGRGGAWGFPKVLLGANLSQPAPWGSRGPVCKGKCGGAASGELLLLCPAPIPAAGVYLGGMRRTHTPETPSRRLVFCLRS